MSIAPTPKAADISGQIELLIRFIPWAALREMVRAVLKVTTAIGTHHIADHHQDALQVEGVHQRETHKRKRRAGEAANDRPLRVANAETDPGHFAPEQNPQGKHAHGIDRNIQHGDRDRRQVQPNADHGAQKGCQHHQALGHGPQRIFAHAAKGRLKQGLLHAQQNSQAQAAIRSAWRPER